MCLAVFVLVLDTTVVNVALPSIQRALDADLATLEWTVNAYTLSFAVLLVTAGRIGDLFGRRRVLLVGLVGFGLSSAAVGLAPSGGLLVAARALQGVAGALVMPSTLSILANTFGEQERGRALGVWAGVSGLGIALGPVIGGIVTEAVGWRAIFFLNVPVSAAAVAIALLAVPESRDPLAARRIDVPGVAALTVGLTALVLALIHGNDWGWGSAAIVALLATAPIALAAFAALERRSPTPLVEGALLRARSFVGAGLVGFTITFAMFAMLFFISLYLQNLLGYSALEAGVRLLPATLAIVPVAPLAGRIADARGPRAPLIAGMVVTAGALLWASFLDPDSGYGFLVAPLMLLGTGIGLVLPPMTTAAMNAVDEAKVGVASGVLSMQRIIGGTFGVAVLGAIVQGVGRARVDDRLAFLPEAAREQIVDSLGSGAENAAGVPPQVVAVAREAFISALGSGLRVGAAVTLAGALAAWLLVADRARPERSARPSTAVAAAGSCTCTESPVQLAAPALR